jgi:hypothetical protein
VRIYRNAQLLEDPGASLFLGSLVREPDFQLLEETCADGWNVQLLGSSCADLQECPVA